jgi:hypothetical protein
VGAELFARQQFDLLRAWASESPDWQDLAMLLIGLLCSGSLAGAALGAVGPPPARPLAAPAAARGRGLRALGVEVAAHHPPRTRAERVRQVLGERGAELAARLEALDRARYGGGPARAAAALVARLCPGGGALPAR